MPLYEEMCPSCGLVKEHFSKFSEGDVVIRCECGVDMERIYSVPSLKIFQPYTTPHILPHGKPITITSERQETSVLRENGLCKADSNPTK